MYIFDAKVDSNLPGSHMILTPIAAEVGTYLVVLKQGLDHLVLRSPGHKVLTHVGRARQYRPSRYWLVKIRERKIAQNGDLYYRLQILHEEQPYQKYRGTVDRLSRELDKLESGKVLQ